MEQFYFFLDTALKFSPMMAHSEYNKEILSGKPFDDRFQNASKKRGKKGVKNQFFKDILPGTNF